MHTQKGVFKVVGTREAKLAQGRGDAECKGLRDGLEHFALLVDQCMVLMPPEDKHRADAVLGEYRGAHNAGTGGGEQRAHLETGSRIVAHDAGLVDATGPLNHAQTCKGTRARDKRGNAGCRASQIGNVSRIDRLIEPVGGAKGNVAPVGDEVEDGGIGQQGICQLVGNEVACLHCVEPEVGRVAQKPQDGFEPATATGKLARKPRDLLTPPLRLDRCAASAVVGECVLVVFRHVVTSASLRWTYTKRAPCGAL